MEAATQVDLARAEVPAGQVANSVLEEAADLKVDFAPKPRDSREPKSPRRSSRGASLSTYQVRLKPKGSSRSRSPVPRRTSDGALATTHLEAGRLAAELQAVDEGFGAWSYVASTFAMYIVVWGESFELVLYLKKRSLILCRARLSAGLSNFSDILVHRP